jgi:hypothetical protein
MLGRGTGDRDKRSMQEEKSNLVQVKTFGEG